MATQRVAPGARQGPQTDLREHLEREVALVDATLDSAVAGTTRARPARVSHLREHFRAEVALQDALGGSRLRFNEVDETIVGARQAARRSPVSKPARASRQPYRLSLERAACGIAAPFASSGRAEGFAVVPGALPGCCPNSSGAPWRRRPALACTDPRQSGSRLKCAGDRAGCGGATGRDR